MTAVEIFPAIAAQPDEEAVRPASAELLFSPNISLNGPINDDTLVFFLERLASVRQTGSDLILELNTSGGDADVARRIALEIRLFKRYSGRQAWCVGKTKVYSAGVTIFAAFDRSCRFLTDDAVLLVHERRLQESIELNGPINSCLQIVREQLAILEVAERLEKQGFEELVAGSTVSADDMLARASSNCFLPASEARRLGLIGGVIE